MTLCLHIISTGTLQGMAGVKQTWLVLCPYMSHQTGWPLYPKDCLLKIPVTLPENFFFLRSTLGLHAGLAGSAKELTHIPGVALDQ